MFNRDLFTYDEQNHLGYYNGVLVPSVTQLVDILFPYNENIPQERLEQASVKGTTIHEAIETLNTLFDNSLDFDINLNEAVDTAIRTGNEELINYVSLLSVYKLRPFDYEEIIFLLDENGELICYGHYDCTLLATKDITVGNVDLFREGRLYLTDYKTTSLFDKKKVALQLSIYATAYEQSSHNQIEGISGTWLKDGIKLIPLVRHEKEYTISLAKQLKDIWCKKQ